MVKEVKSYPGLVKVKDKRTERSFVTYKSVMRLKKEDSPINEIKGTGITDTDNATPCKKCDRERLLIPKWEKKRILKKKFTSTRCRENALDLLENMEMYKVIEDIDMYEY